MTHTDVRNRFKGVFGFPITYGNEQWQFKFGYTHLSSHLGDELALRNIGLLINRVNYVRDSLLWGTSYYPIPAWRVYGEAALSFHHDGGAGPWEDDPNADAWWGDEPPFHHPVFVLTHHARDPLEMQGGTTFTFVTDGIESALEQARRAAGGQDVALAGGADVAQQYLAAGLIDQMDLHVVPLVLGAGARLFDNLGGAAVKLEQVRAVEAPGVTHLRYRAVR